MLPLAIHGKRAVAAAQEAVRTQRRIGILLQKDDSEEPGSDALHRVGTIASILRFVTAPDGTHHVICQGEERFAVLGGDAETIKARFAASEETLEPLSVTLKNAVGALAGPDRTIEVSDLEVGILEDRGSRRTFARLNDEQVSELLR